MPASPDFVQDMTIALGGSLVDVELQQEDFDYALNKAIRTFQQRGNNNLDRKFVTFDVSADVRVYSIDPSYNIDTVVRIIRPSSSFSSADPFSSSYIQNLFGPQSSMTGSSLLTYELGMQLLENIEIYTAKQIQFIWKKRNNELVLLDTPKVDETWMMEVYADLTEEEYEEILWIRNYALAELKIILGRAYRKHGTIMTPAGESQLDGEQLVQEGKEEQLILLENISDYIDGEPAGGVIFIG